MIEIDGSYGEGGGAVIRTALALSILSRQAFRVVNIRKNRPKQGLAAQHLSSVFAARDLCEGIVKGAQLGSTEIVFSPGILKGRTLSVDIGTAGSITLLLQAILLPCMFGDGKTRLRIRGGTDTKWSMPIDYFSNVFVPYASKYANIECELVRRGYYPEGGGMAEVRIEPRFCVTDFPDFEGFRKRVREEIGQMKLDEWGEVVGIEGISHASESLRKSSVSERQGAEARKSLMGFDCPVRIRDEYCKARGMGSGITLWARLGSGGVIGSDALGEKIKRAEEVGREAANALLNELEKKAPVDSHLADQLIPFIALFGGSYRTTEITSHALTNMYVAERFLGRSVYVDEKKKIIFG